jgi:hypothetical protein
MSAWYRSWCEKASEYAVCRVNGIGDGMQFVDFDHGEVGVAILGQRGNGAVGHVRA